jgi:predicted HAD superfamily Cof-like phosphohydrolase
MAEWQITLTHIVSIPQLDTLGDRLMSELDSIRAALTGLSDRLTATIAEELHQLADRLATTVSAADKQAVLDQVQAMSDNLTAQIAGMVPDVPPAP